jgi:hypothetical protein
MEHISKALQGNINNLHTVNSGNSNKITESTVNSINTVNSMSIKDELEELFQRHGIKPEGMAMELAQLLKDEDSISYYKILIKENDPYHLIELAHQVKEMDLEGKIRTTRPIYFQGILRRQGIKTKFKKDK